MKALIITSLAALFAVAPMGVTARTGSAASSQSQYRAALLWPQNGHDVMGAVAIMPHGSESYTIAITLRGATIHTNYLVHTTLSACNKQPGTVTKLATLKANAMGNALTITTVPAAKVPSKTVGIVITPVGANGREHGGSFAACGALFKPDMTVQLKPGLQPQSQKSRAKGVALIKESVPLEGYHVKSGTAVVLYMTNLEGLVAQPSAVAHGQCGSEGPAIYPLLPLVSDQAGQSVQGTAVLGSIPHSGLSIHVHRADFHAEACGNIS